MVTREIAGEQFALYIPNAEIVKCVTPLAQSFAEDYKGLDPHIIIVALGALPFATAFTQAAQEHDPDLDMTWDVINLSSYGNEPTSSGTVRENSKLSLPFGGRHVVVVEDIVDTGTTLDYFLKRLRYGEPSDSGPIPPASLEVATLLDKPYKHNGRVRARYIGFYIPDVWVAGYGMDHMQRGRALNDIYRSLERGHQMPTDVETPGFTPGFSSQPNN